MRGHGDSEHYEEVDATVSHSGGQSIKLYQRAYGGRVRRDFNLPLPEGTLIKLSFWVLCPRGGSFENKHFSGGLGTPDAMLANLDVFDASPNWRPYVLSTSLSSFTDRFHVEFGTGSGNGSYQGFDWATWVDDVKVEVVLKAEAQSWTVTDDDIAVVVRLPEGYERAKIVPGSARLVSQHSVFDWSPGIVAETVDGRASLTFKDVPRLIDEIQAPSSSPGHTPGLGIRLQLAVPDNATGAEFRVAAACGIRKRERSANSGP